MEFTEQLESAEGAAVFKSCLETSRTLQHQTVLEGIETAEQYTLALQSGVNYIQGFHIAKPLQHEELAAFIQGYGDGKK